MSSCRPLHCRLVAVDRDRLCHGHGTRRQDAAAKCAFLPRPSRPSSCSTLGAHSHNSVRSTCLVNLSGGLMYTVYVHHAQSVECTALHLGEMGRPRERHRDNETGPPSDSGSLIDRRKVARSLVCWQAGFSGAHGISSGWRPPARVRSCAQCRGLRPLRRSLTTTLYNSKENIICCQEHDGEP